MARNENMIAALKRERALYVSQGADDRVAQVDESLKHYGYEPDAAGEGDGPQGRTAAPQQTADSGPGAGKDEAKPPAKKTAAKRTAGAPAAE